jgi:hypothetical protein
MKNHIPKGSPELLLELNNAGCPIGGDQEALARCSAALSNPFCVQTIPDFVGRVFQRTALHTVWLFPIRVRTDHLSGTLISRFAIELPMPDYELTLDYEAERVIPKDCYDYYRPLLGRQLQNVLNEGSLIRCGYPVQGVVCGCSPQQIDEWPHDSLPVNIVLIDNRGNPASLRMEMEIIKRRGAVESRIPGHRGPDFQRLFDDDILASPGAETESLPVNPGPVAKPEGSEPHSR